MFLDKVFHIQGAEHSQTSAVASLPAQRMNDSRQVRNQENFRDDKASRFSEVLKEVDAVNRREEEPRKSEKSGKDSTIKEKVEELEQKIEKIEKSAEIEGKEKPQLDELKSVLEKIKALMENPNVDQNMKLDFGKVSIDLNTFLTAIMNKLSEMLNNPQRQDMKNLLSFLDKKLTEIQSTLAVSGNIKKAEPSVEPNRNKVAQNDSGKIKTDSEEKNVSPDKVKVIDQRTAKEETPVLSTDKPKTQKENILNIIKTDNKNEQPVLKPDNQQKLSEKEILDMLKAKDNTPQLMDKTDKFQNVIAKQYSSFTSSVSKANLEALMQGITGKALVTLQDGKSEMKMNLTPPELGRMKMEFSLEDGQMIGKIVVSTPEAKALFDQNMAELQRALQQAGINLAQMDVSLGNQGAENSEQESAQNGNSKIKGTVSPNEILENTEINSERNIYGSSINYLA